MWKVRAGLSASPAPCPAKTTCSWVAFLTSSGLSQWPQGCLSQSLVVTPEDTTPSLRPLWPGAQPTSRASLLFSHESLSVRGRAKALLVNNGLTQTRLTFLE